METQLPLVVGNVFSFRRNSLEFYFYTQWISQLANSLQFCHHSTSNLGLSSDLSRYSFASEVLHTVFEGNYCTISQPVYTEVNFTSEVLNNGLWTNSNLDENYFLMQVRCFMIETITARYEQPTINKNSTDKQ